MRRVLIAVSVALLSAAALIPSAMGAAVLGGPLQVPLPLFPATNWWNLDVSNAPVDTGSAALISFIDNGSPRKLHPDLGGDVSTGSIQNYGMSYLVVDGTQPKKSVSFLYSGESDGVDHTTDQSFPFYPIPDEAITQAHWVEGGEPGNVDLRNSADRHILIVDKDNNTLYELYNVWYDTANAKWFAGSGAFFDMKTDNRRTEGWTSADAAGLAILPGLLRYDEVYGPAEIGHALRVTVRTTNGYVYPASHVAGSTTGALPMGARLRLKSGKNISSFSADAQKIFRAMKQYGLIVADNGSDMYVGGTYDNRWDNGILNPAFSALTADDFDVIQLGYAPPVPTITAVTPSSGPNAGGTSVTIAGTSFAAGAVVKFGLTQVTPTNITATSLMVTTPSHAAGVVDVTVANTTGAVATRPGGFTFTTNINPRGDVNGDGVVTVADIFYLISYLFSAGQPPIGSGDANKDGSVNTSDIFYLINFLFSGGPAPGP